MGDRLLQEDSDFLFILTFMKLIKQWKSLLAATCIIVIFYVLVSFLDIAIAFFYSRFYSPAAFIVSFCVGGIFAAVFGYFYGIRLAPEKNELARWSLILTMIAIGLFFFFFWQKWKAVNINRLLKPLGRHWRSVACFL